MSYGTCVSAGEKAIGLDQDKRKKWGGGGGAGGVGSNKQTTNQNGCRPAPPPLTGFDGA